METYRNSIGELDFIVRDGEALVAYEGGFEPLTVEQVLELSEFAAAAHEALTGSLYEPKEYSAGGYVTQGAGPVVTLGSLAQGHAIPKSAILGGASTMFSGTRFPQARAERGA